MPAENQIKYFGNKPTERRQLHNVEEHEIQKQQQQQHRPAADSRPKRPPDGIGLLTPC